MKKLFLLTVLITCTSLFGGYRIIGGQVAPKGEYPWMVSIRKKNNNMHLCGGTLIDPEWVLTAGHCIVSPFGNIKTKDDIKLVIGRYNIREDEGETIDAEEIFVNHEFSILFMENDIALIKLKTPSAIPSVTLEEIPEEYTAGEYATVMGWGVQANYAMHDLLHEVEVPVVSNEECREAGNAYETVQETTICAGYASGGKDACQGDSGGPLIRKNGEKYTQIGIVSWGEGCAEPGKYGVYTNVSKYLNWIEDVQNGEAYSEGEKKAPPGSIYAPAEFGKTEYVVIQPQIEFKEYYRELITYIVKAEATPLIVYNSDSIKPISKSDVIEHFLAPISLSENRVRLFDAKYNSHWSRDWSPLPVYADGELTFIDNRYKAPFNRPLDDQFPGKLGKELEADVYFSDLFTEGGNFMTDGRGTCWQSFGVIDQKGNTISEAEITSLFRSFYGCDRVFYPDPIPGEHTTHIDMYSKVLNEETIVVSISDETLGAAKSEIKALEKIASLFKKIEKPDGGKYNVVRVPMSFGSSKGGRLYKTHTNSLIVNSYVLVPTYGGAKNDEALEIYRKLMPNHTVVGINSDKVIALGGSIHCTTMQIPPKRYSECGNGVVDENEECEPTFPAKESCHSLGYEKGALSCGSDCMFDCSGCEARPKESGDDDANEDEEPAIDDEAENRDEEKKKRRVKSRGCSLIMML